MADLLDDGSDGSGISSVNLVNDASGVSKPMATVDGGYSVSLDAPLEGENSYTITATDNVGNSASSKLRVLYDATPPTITAGLVHYGADGKPSIDITVADATSGVDSSAVVLTDTSTDVGKPVSATVHQDDADPRDEVYTVDLAKYLQMKTLSVVATDRCGNAATKRIDVRYPANPKNYPIQNIGAIAYGESGTGYVAQIGISAEAFEDCKDDDALVLERLIGTVADGVTTWSSASSDGGYEWTVPISTARTDKYVITDTISVGARTAHKAVKYTAKLETSGGASYGEYMDSAARTVENTAAKTSFSFSSGAETLLSIGEADSAEGLAYNDGTPCGAAVAFSSAGTSDVDGDTLSYKAVRGAKSVALTEGMNASAIVSGLSEGGVVGSRDHVLLDGVRIVCTETSGAWSKESESGAFDIEIDRRAPTGSLLGSIQRENGGSKTCFYTNTRDFSLGLTGTDDESGIREIKVSVTSYNGTGTGDVKGLVKKVSTAGASPTLSETELNELRDGYGLDLCFIGRGAKSLLNYSLPWRLPDKDGNYSFKAELYDAAGNAAEPCHDIVLSKELKADWELSSDPNNANVFTMGRDKTGGIGTAGVDVGLGFFVMKKDGVTTKVDLTAQVTRRGGSGETYVATVTDEGAGVNRVSFETAVYGNYTVTVQAAGADTLKYSIPVVVRVNKPAELTMNNITTTSGRTVTLNWGAAGSGAVLVASDDDQTDANGAKDTPYRVGWTVYDGEPGTSGATVRAALDASAHPASYRFEKAESEANATYWLMAKLQDAWGAVSTAQCQVTVTNTSSGVLAENETWSGSHEITGTITIPKDITLTILDGCQVTVRTGSGAATAEGGVGSAPRIVVAAGGTLVAGKAVIAAEGQAYWGGVETFGACRLSGTELDGALVGVSVGGQTGTGCALSAVKFIRSLVGLQLVSGKPAVTGCSFVDSGAYAIKGEKGAGGATVRDCTFSGNKYLYYDGKTGTIEGLADLNGMSGNGGNK